MLLRNCFFCLVASVSGLAFAQIKLYLVEEFHIHENFLRHVARRHY